MNARSFWPLCGHAQPDAVLARDADGPITVRQWLHDVHALAARLPADCTHVLNVCRNRYLFLVGFGAGIVSGRVSLQPSSLAPEAVRHLLQHAPRPVCLHDGESEGLEALMPLLPVVRQLVPSKAQDVEIPQIPAEQVVSLVFTSGSTGQPVPHAKTWGKLHLNALAEAQMLGLDQGSQTCIVGTVPSQHMYGFESVMLLALLAGCSLWTGRPFYPADVAQALASVPQPRMLVTTPVHLRVLVDAGLDYPPVDQLLCATAPLAPALAGQAEAHFGAPLREIYGSTETSQLAVRRPLEGPAWRLFPGVRLEQQGDTTFASGCHVEGRVPMSDVIELVGEDGFILHGRKTDMVNIAGRRSSLAYLNHQLAQIPGIQDGAFFLPKPVDVPGGHAPLVPEVERLCLVAQAPGMSARDILDALHPYVEAVFLPRPLILVERMPRNETGKLPQQALQGLYAEHQLRQHAAAHKPDLRWQVPVDHPVFAGHFRGQPVVPGALLLQRCVDAWRALPQARGQACSVQQAKFLLPCGPGDVLDIRLEPVEAPGKPFAASFRVLRGEETVASGTLRALSAPAQENA